MHQREDILKRSHDLCSLLLLTQKVIHSLRVKVHIAEYVPGFLSNLSRFSLILLLKEVPLNDS